jgi:MFS family permease
MVLEWVKTAPRAFKVLLASALIENIAFGLILPYLTIYMTRELDISDTLAGVVLASWTLAGVPAVILGGMLADKIGRRFVLLTSLGLMSVTMMLYFFASGFASLLAIVIADSFVGSLYMPAANAMVADVIPSQERPNAYSAIRIGWNSGMVIGPAIGVFIVVTYSIRELFLFGAAILAFAFLLNVLLVPETRPESALQEEVTFRKVMAVSRNRPFLLLIILTGCLWFFMTQWMSVLAVYATSPDDLNLAESVPGTLFVINALMVVSLQLWVTSRMVRLRPSLVLMAGQMIVATGFMTIFFATDFSSLVACIVYISIGELIYMSIISAIVADMSPESQRGVYMGFMGFVQSLAMGVGFFFGMLLLDVLPDHRYIWIIFGMFGLITSLGYIAFARMIGRDKDVPSRKVTEAGS